MMKVDWDRLQALLAEHSGPQEWLRWWSFRGEAGEELLEDVRSLATDADPRIRRQTWDALDLLVDDSNRDLFYGLLIDGLAEDQFRTLLTDTDPEVRTRVCWVDTRNGYYRVPRVQMAMELLADKRFDYAWPECIEVLRRPMDFDFLVGALVDASSEGLRGRLSVTLGLPAATRMPEISPQQSTAPIRCTTWDGCGEVYAAHRCRHLPVLLALLGSSIETVRDKARWALERFGPGIVDALRLVRRSNSAAGRAALVMLAEFGWKHIPAEDLVLLRRLIRMKQQGEAPQSVGMRDGAWFALPTTDQAAVLDALDLTDPVPATMRMGFAPWQGAAPERMPTDTWALRQGDFWTENSQLYRHGLFPEVFVSPVLDGWTLVFCRNETLGGLIPASTSPQSRYELYQRMEKLSLRFGAAHWYEQFIIDDYAGTIRSQWCIAGDGEIRMHCVSSDDVYVYRCEEDDPVDSLAELDAWMTANEHGREPRPAQEQHDWAEAYESVLDDRNGDDRLPPENQEPDPAELDGRIPAAEPAQDLVFGARAAAQRLSINLASLGPHIPTEGTGVLAVPHSLRHLLRRGALPI
ncbi:hypothetical protein ABZ942_32485 [Nocardia sp. NPDC046473]|uniref:hypothetical protein n=1 Tax=Nocardia sp. NPDC046473 TaxID=3155733 RepID=UPI0033FAEADF